MKILSLIKLKTGPGYNLLIDDDVVGRVSTVTPNFNFEYLEYIPTKLANIPKSYKPKDLKKEILTFKNFKIDGIAKKFFLKGKEIYLSETQFNLLYLFCFKPGECIDHEEIEMTIFGRPTGTNLTAVHIKCLKAKIGDLVENVRGIGYRLKQ